MHVNVITSMGINMINIKLSCLVGEFTCQNCISDEGRDKSIKVPCPPNTSVHPWSRVFMAWWEAIIGVLIMACVLRGVRNHIIKDLASVIGSVIKGVGEEVRLLDRATPNQAPNKAAINGMSFIVVERIGWGKGEMSSQFNAAPPMIAPTVKINNGVERFVSVSLRFDKGVAFRSDQSKLIDNRTE